MLFTAEPVSRALGVTLASERRAAFEKRHDTVWMSRRATAREPPNRLEAA